MKKAHEIMGLGHILAERAGFETAKPRAVVGR